jgi:hypothetical protein
MATGGGLRRHFSCVILAQAEAIIRSKPMLRLMIALLAALAASGTAESADRALAPHRWHRAAAMLPPGLPRRHYRFRTTYDTPYVYRRSGPRVTVYENPEFWYAPDYAYVPYIPPLIGTPWLPGSLTLPGYYGSSYSYEYEGPYYGGPYVGYWDRLPYACGVYGYC